MNHMLVMYSLSDNVAISKLNVAAHVNTNHHVTCMHIPNKLSTQNSAMPIVVQIDCVTEVMKKHLLYLDFGLDDFSACQIQ